MNLKELLESKIREFDASIDLTDGSRIQRTVITPILNSLSTDPLSVNTRDYLYARFSEVFPDAPITRGNALDDILITAAEYFISGYREELSRLKNATSIENLDLLSDDEADALASNWFVSRDGGASAIGSVTITVDRTSAISINIGSVRFFGGDQEYAPTTSAVITTDALLAGSLGGGLYSFTINVRSITVGTVGNISAGRITRASGIPNVVSVTNESPITGGVSRDSTEYLLTNKLPRAISERSLVTARGIGARIATDIPGILRYQVIGHGDAEMTRDRVEVQSYSDLVANGHAYYMNNFAFITGYRYLSDVLATNDDLCVLDPLGAPAKYKVMRVLNSLDVNILNNNANGFTKLVELDSAILDQTSGHVSVLRPNTTLLDNALVDGTVGLGGRVDVHMRGDDQQSVVGSAVIALEDSYRGSGWVSLDNIVTITLDAPLFGNEFSRYDHIILEGIAYTISSIDYVVGELSATIHIFDQTLPNSNGGDYYITTDLVYNTSATSRTVCPSRGGVGRLSTIIGSSEVSILDVDLIKDGVRQGDIIEILELGIRRSIFSVSSQTVAFTDTPFQQTLSDVGARVIRSVASAVNPITELDIPSFMPKHPIGVDIKNIREEIGVVSSGIGTVLLPLGGRLLDALNNVGTIFANVLNRDSIFYRIPTVNESGNRISRLTPTAYGYNKDRLGRCSVLIGEPIPLNNGASESGINEFNTWTDLFTSNANNMFVLRGDTLTSGSSLDYPGKDAQAGDVLRISSGYLSGDYVIESVINNTLVKSSHGALTSDTPGESTILHTGQYTYKDITDEANLDQDVIFQNVTLVRIYGEFPNNPLNAIAKYLDFSVTPRFIGIDNETVGSLDSAFINSYLNGNSNMFRADMSNEILAAFRSSVSASLLSADTEDIDINLRALFSDVLNTTYEIIRPSEGVGQVVTRRESEQVLLSKPSIQHIDINDMMLDLRSGNLRSVNHRDYSELVGSAGTYHISPIREYYVDGNDYREWNNVLRPILYDDRSLPASYKEHYEDAFFIFDELVEATSSGIMPITVSGLSSVAYPFLRNSGSRLIRHAEVDVINAPLALLPQSSVSLESFIFAAPFFPDEETRIIPIGGGYTAPKVYMISPDDAIEVYGDVPALNYIYTGTDAYNALIASLGNAVDGTGTLLSEIYSQYDAFFELEATANSTQDVLEYLVSLYGQIVEARFWREEIPSIDHFITDEFLAETLLPRSGNVYDILAQSNRPISVATVSERSDKLEIIPSTTLSLLSDTLAGLKARIAYRDSVYWRNVSYTTGNDVYLDEPLPFGTPTALAYGLCIYDSEVNKIRLISDPIFSGGQGAVNSWDEEFTTHLNTGGASRQILSSDIGKHITLWGYRSNDADYLSVLLNSPVPEYETEDEFLSSVLGPERQTFGQFEITDVVPTFVDVVRGAEATPAKIDISISGTVDLTTQRVSGTEATLIACAFVVTSPTLTLEDNLINSVAQVTMYRSAPYEYDFVGVSKTTSDRYIVQGRSGTLNYNYALLSDELTSGQAVSTFVLQDDNSLEPTTVETNHLIQISDKESLVIRTTNARAAINNQTISVDGSDGLGYDLIPSKLSHSMSTQDNVAIHIPCTPGPVDQTVSVSGYFDASTGLAQSLVDLTSERPICANILVKSLCTAYIGLEVLYVGGPTEDELVSELESFVRSRIISEGSITRSMITSIVMNMGATTVHEPIDLYVCIEDRSRRIHKRTIVDSLEDATLFNVDATLRTLYPSIAVDNRLGANISVQRFSSLSNLIGNGGS